MPILRFCKLFSIWVLQTLNGFVIMHLEIKFPLRQVVSHLNHTSYTGLRVRTPRQCQASSISVEDSTVRQHSTHPAYTAGFKGHCEARRDTKRTTALVVLFFVRYVPYTIFLFQSNKNACQVARFMLLCKG